MSSDSRLILASKSPRRSQLLEEAGFNFRVFTLDVDESYPPDLGVDQIAQFLSEKKNAAYRKHFTREVVLTADTTVVLGDALLEKPADASEAVAMIEQLSGKTHQVISGVTISSHLQVSSFSVATSVSFKVLTSEEINYYVERYQPMDKAGSYGIQEWIGLIGVKEIRGSYFNVMGLPTERLYEELTQKFDIWPGDRPLTSGS